VSALELKRFPPFSELDAADTEILEDLLEALDMERGDVVVREGDEADGLLLVQRGSLEMTSDRISELRGLGAGECMGGLSLASLGRREVTLTASEPTTVLLLSRSAFLRLSEDAPRAATRVLEAVLRELGNSLRTGLEGLF